MCQAALMPTLAPAAGPMTTRRWYPRFSLRLSWLFWKRALQLTQGHVIFCYVVTAQLLLYVWRITGRLTQRDDDETTLDADSDLNTAPLLPLLSDIDEADVDCAEANDEFNPKQQQQYQHRHHHQQQQQEVSPLPGDELGSYGGLPLPGEASWRLLNRCCHVLWRWNMQCWHLLLWSCSPRQLCAIKRLLRADNLRDLGQVTTRNLLYSLSVVSLLWRWRLRRPQQANAHFANILHRGSQELKIDHPYNHVFTLYRRLPLRTMSRMWGRLNQLELPVWLRGPLYHLYSWLFSCNIHEAAVTDLSAYRNLSEFFRRNLKSDVRPIDGSQILTCPADGRVLYCGRVERGRLEQVKGVSYSMHGFLGPLEGSMERLYLNTASLSAPPSPAFSLTSLSQRSITPESDISSPTSSKSSGISMSDSGISLTRDSLRFFGDDSQDSSSDCSIPDDVLMDSDPGKMTRMDEHLEDDGPLCISFKGRSLMQQCEDVADMETDSDSGMEDDVDDSVAGEDGCQDNLSVMVPQDLCDESYAHSLMTNTENELFQCIIYLAPGDYHRFHSPTDWTVQARRHFPGELFSVSPGIARWLQGLFSLNERAVYVGKWMHGFFSMTAVGATNVGSINVLFDEDLQTNTSAAYEPGCYNEKQFGSRRRQGVSQSKGSLMGDFNLGSTIVLLFEAPKHFQFCVKPGDLVKYGKGLGSYNKSPYRQKRRRSHLRRKR